MSLIDEALKRAQAAGQKDGARPAERPWVPSPMPDAGLARRRRLLPVAGVAAVVAAAVSAVFLFLPRPGPPAPRIATGAGPSGGNAAPAVAPVVQPTSVPTAAAEIRPTLAPRPRPTRTPYPDGGGTIEGETVVAPPPQAASQGGTLVSGKTYAGAVSLPGGAKIELGGIVWSETEPRALLNDRIAAVGAYVEGFTLSKIEQDRIALQKDGVTIFISVK